MRGVPGGGLVVTSTRELGGRLPRRGSPDSEAGRPVDICGATFRAEEPAAQRPWGRAVPGRRGSGRGQAEG